ncbi:hypothetical protein [Lysobacter olei]
MDWLWLSLTCMVVALATHYAIRWFWLALPLAALLGPLAHITLTHLVLGDSGSTDGLALVFGQVVALPISALAGAVIRELGSRRYPDATSTTGRIRTPD